MVWENSVGGQREPAPLEKPGLFKPTECIPPLYCFTSSVTPQNIQQCTDLGMFGPNISIITAPQNREKGNCNSAPSQTPGNLM